ncbi:MAG: hypothetical protein ACM3ZF_14670, partial [Mycobacterium leprae]
MASTSPGGSVAGTGQPVARSRTIARPSSGVDHRAVGGVPVGGVRWGAGAAGRAAPEVMAASRVRGRADGRRPVLAGRRRRRRGR